MAADTPGSLTKQEFEQLLARAAERHTLSEPRDFTVGELVEVGRELGIDERTVRAVHAEHQRELARPAGRPKPFDSQLQLAARSDIFSLTIPPKGGAGFVAGVRTLIAGGIATGVATGGFPWPVVAAVSTLAAGTIYFSIRAARTRRELRLNRDGSGMLIRFVGEAGRGIPIHPGQLHARLAERRTSQEKQPATIRFVALDHGTETYELLEGYSHAEQAWAVQEIERWLGR